MKRILLISTVLFISFQLNAQKEKQGGLQFATLGSFDQYFFTQSLEGGSSTQFRSANLYPEQYFQGYQLGLISRKKSWNQNQFNFIYFPKFERIYTDFNIDNSSWTESANAVRNLDLEIYMLGLSKVIKINIFAGSMFLNLGAGLEGGIFKFTLPESPDDPLMAFAGQLVPSAGLELILFKHLGIFGDFRYHYGLSEEVSVNRNTDKYEYLFNLEGREIKAGVSIYF